MAVKYSNSPLATDSVDLSEKSNNRKNATYNKTGAITKITPHHMAGKYTGKACAEMHKKTSRQASANYYIGYAGDICLGVEESRRAWTSGSRENDYNAVTIEVSNNVIGGDWHVSDESYSALIALITDICLRNNIKAINYTGDASGNLTKHCYFAATACPGPYLGSKFDDIAQQVNANLAGGVTPSPDPGPKYTEYIVQRGDTLSKIAQKFDVTVSEIARLNNIQNINIIRVGQKLIIPEATSERKPLYHIVKKGDTLTKICLMYDVTMQRIQELNPQIKNINKIYIMQKIRVY